MLAGIVARTRGEWSDAPRGGRCFPALQRSVLLFMVVLAADPASMMAADQGHLQGTPREAEDGYPDLLVETSSAEMIQDWNPGAKVVKALATMGSLIIDEPLAAGGLVTILLASNHRRAKEKVAGMVAELGLDPVDFGPLLMARAM